MANSHAGKRSLTPSRATNKVIITTPRTKRDYNFRRNSSSNRQPLSMKNSGSGSRAITTGSNMTHKINLSQNTSHGSTNSLVKSQLKNKLAEISSKSNTGIQPKNSKEELIKTPI
jgi:hypothetical protein